MKYFIKADKFFLRSGIETGGYLLVKDGKFGKRYNELPNKETQVIDYSGQWIAPGLVDTHIHGYANYDVMDNELEGLKEISEGLLSCGVTSFLPTTLTADHTLLHNVAKTIGTHHSEVNGAKIQGIYFEGPYFTEKYKGAQNPSYFTDPSIDEFHEWQSAANGMIRKIAIAPERDNSEEFISQVTSEGVVVALGHSDATLEEAKRCTDAGASVFVHAYNGMKPLNHREPGMVGAVLSLKDIFAELICDGHHVSPNAAKIVMDSCGHDHVALITDCMMAGGMPDGDYMLGEFPVVVKDGTARLESGNLAGSILKLKEAIKNVVDWGIATPEEAIEMATHVPAQSCGIDNKCGTIMPGRDADFIVLSPDMQLNATYLDGLERFKA